MTYGLTRLVMLAVFISMSVGVLQGETDNSVVPELPSTAPTIPSTDVDSEAKSEVFGNNDETLPDIAGDWSLTLTGTSCFQGTCWDIGPSEAVYHFTQSGETFRGTVNFQDGSSSVYEGRFINDTDVDGQWHLPTNLGEECGAASGSGAQGTFTGRIDNGRMDLSLDGTWPHHNQQSCTFAGNGSFTGNVVGVTSSGQPPMIAVTMDDATPETVRVGGDINYEITITNISSGNATGITLTSDLPTSVFLAFTPQSSQGTCAGSGIATVTCDLGSLTTGASANVFITATPTESGQITTTAIVSPGNEMATTTTTVEPAPETTVILPGLSTSINLGLLIQSMDQCVFKRNKPECTGLGLTLLQNKPGLTGELAAEFLRQQLAITCSTEGIATRNPLRCSPLFLFVLSELIAPPEVR